jgi:hypothetical protein
MGSIPGVASTGIEVATLRKLRLRLLPFLLALYVIAFLDRTNLGFAALTMNRELGITSEQFGLAAGIFFWGYFLLEIPSNLILHKIGARVWIARILITWGSVAALTGFVQSAHQLYVARFALGLAEAGYFPGIALYLGYWLPSRAKAQALALIIIGIPLASVSGFRAHSGPRALVRLERLAVVADPGRIARNSVRFFDESTAAKPACGGAVSHRGGKGLDRRSIGARRAAEARVAIDFCGTDSYSSASLALGVHWLWCRLCQLHILVLASTDAEVPLGWRLQ